jgi:hypothetical protein
MGRTKIILHSQMNSQRASYEPAATAFCQVRRLRNLRYAKNTFIKGARFRLSTGWHCQLHVIDLSNAHENPTSMLSKAENDAGGKARIALLCAEEVRREIIALDDAPVEAGSQLVIKASSYRIREGRVVQAAPGAVSGAK